MRCSIRTLKILAAAAILSGVAGFLLSSGGVGAAQAPAPANVETFAAIQFAAPRRDPEQNKKRLVSLIAEAKERGARYVVLPELALGGALPNVGPDTKHPPPVDAETIPGPTTRFFGAYAKKLGVWLVLAIPEKANDQRGYYITAVLIDDRGEVAYKCRKNLVRSNNGDGLAIRGKYRDIVDTVDNHGLRLGVVSGDDIQVGVPRLAERGAGTILVTAEWDADDLTDWGELCRRLSRQYAVNIVVANRLRVDQMPGGRTRQLGGIYSRQGTALGPEGRTGGEVVTAALSPAESSWVGESALGLPASVPSPVFLSSSSQMVELGRTLFFDKNLSSTGVVSCSSCHQPQRAFTNGEEKGIGVYGRKTKRNVPSLLNVAYRPLLQWDGYASTLENFAKYPVSGYTEMNFHYLDNVVQYLRSRPEYVAAFRSVGVEEIEFDDVAHALSAYQRSLISGNSAFDRYYYGGDKSALGESARRGLGLFTGKARCSSCHVIGERYALFMDFKYHVVGVGYLPEKREFSDVGLGAISTGDLSGLFLTPSLRNIAETGPYMHDGSLKTLEDVVEFFNRGGIPNPSLDPLVRPLSLSEREKKDLVAFLRSLTGDQQYSAQGQRVAASARKN